ncbi:MAG: hypothetical protein LBD22_01310 [Spirochaetaceae bacterium]|jgi:hypothetical protein|nr:hypothetical protein [Spirochaetaceae bacterium]
MITFKTVAWYVRCVIILMQKPIACLICMGFLSIIALGDYRISGLVRRTIVFYSPKAETKFVEERFVARTGSRADDIRVFAEEVALGPSEWDAAPLIDRSAVLESFFVRENTVYIGFSEEAVLPPAPVGMAAGDVQHNLRSIERDIKRNFRGIKAVRFFIRGREMPRAG